VSTDSDNNYQNELESNDNSSVDAGQPDRNNIKRRKRMKKNKTRLEE
jgi:hypothetical protein